MNRPILIMLALVLLPASLSAAEPVADVIINNEGIGFSRMESGQVIAYDPVAAYNHQIIEADCSAHNVDYRGVTWCFANGENRQLFQSAANDGQNNYIPFGGGHCSLGLAFGNLTARGDPRTAIRIGNQLVLNGNLDVRTRFLQDSERNMDMATLRFDMAVKDGSLSPNE
jgi:YHS domain-containing protein